MMNASDSNLHLISEGFPRLEGHLATNVRFQPFAEWLQQVSVSGRACRAPNLVPNKPKRIPTEMEGSQAEMMRHALVLTAACVFAVLRSKS